MKTINYLLLIVLLFFSCTEKNQANKVESDDFVTFLQQFLQECYWNVNFNKMLLDNDEHLAKYIDPQLDVRRYDAPGAVALLYARDQNFGFNDYTDFELKLDGSNWRLEEMPKDKHYTEVEECDSGTGLPIIYYELADSVPEEMIDPSTFTSRPVELPYPDAKIMIAYLPNYYNGNLVAPRVFYFIETPSGWKLAFLDDSFLSA